MHEKCWQNQNCLILRGYLSSQYLKAWVSIQILYIWLSIQANGLHVLSAQSCGNNPITQSINNPLRLTPITNENNLGAWPWMVSAGEIDARTFKYQHICGGSLGTESHVLTAAHCVHDKRSGLSYFRY